jgi:arsenite-transporting ATPase
MSIERQDDSYVLTLQLPFITKGDVSLMRSGDELVVTIGNLRRSILLPQILLGRKLKGAKLDTGRLYIRFDAGQVSEKVQQEDS